jgi:DNA-binding FadR family transcriptional regulator
MLQMLPIMRNFTPLLYDDMTIHGLILQMTGSPLIAGMQQVLTEFFAAATQGARRPGSSDESTIWQHHEIESAIRDRDIDRARSMMRLHFRSFLRSESLK